MFNLPLVSYGAPNKVKPVAKPIAKPAIYPAKPGGTLAQPAIPAGPVNDLGPQYTKPVGGGMPAPQLPPTITPARPGNPYGSRQGPLRGRQNMPSQDTTTPNRRQINPYLR